MKKSVYCCLGFIVVIYIAVACSSDRFILQSSSPQINTPLSLVDKFPTLEVPTYQFELNQTQINIETTPEEINLLIPKNSLAYENGETITEPIQVNFKSYFNKEDMLVKGLTTRANNQLLVSSGMFEVEATVPSGRPLKIISPWRIEIPLRSKKARDESLIFDGQMQGDSILNWVNPSPPDKKLVPVPFEILYNNYSGGEFHFLRFLMPHLDFAKYQNTWFATPELFNTRYYKAYDHLYHMATYLDEEKKPSPLDSNIISIFLPYANDPLYKVDSALLNKIKVEHEKALKQGYIQFNYQFLDSDEFIRWYPTDYNTVNRMQLFIDSTFEATYIDNQNIQYTTIDERFLLEVDSVALRKFSKDLTSIDTTSEQYQKHKKRFVTYYQSVASLFDFGWKNVDYFLLNGTPPEEVLYADVNINTSIPTDKVFVVLDGINVVDGISKRREQLFKRDLTVPKGQKATFIALSTTADNQIKLGYIHTELTETVALDIDLNQTCPPEELKTILKKILP